MKFVRYWIPWFIFAALIFALSSIHGDEVPPLPLDLSVLSSWLPLWFVKVISENPDKMGHACLYGVFGWVSLRAVARGTSIRFPDATYVAFLLTSIYGASDEWHQSFVPKRSCDFNDWLADLSGSLISIILFHRRYKHQNGK